MDNDNLKKSALVDSIVKQVSGGKEPVKQQKTPIVKEAAPKIKEKLYYEIKIETMLPATITYRILAEDPQQAVELMRGAQPIGVKHRLAGKRDIKLSVYMAGSSLLLWAKNLAGF